MEALNEEVVQRNIKLTNTREVCIVWDDIRLFLYIF